MLAPQPIRQISAISRFGQGGEDDLAFDAVEFGFQLRAAQGWGVGGVEPGDHVGGGGVAAFGGAAQPRNAFLGVFFDALAADQAAPQPVHGFRVVVAGGALQPLHGFGGLFVAEEEQGQITLRANVAGVGGEDAVDVVRVQLERCPRSDFREPYAGYFGVTPPFRGRSRRSQAAVGNAAPQRALAQAA